MLHCAWFLDSYLRETDVSKMVDIRKDWNRQAVAYSGIFLKFFGTITPKMVQAMNIMPRDFGEAAALGTMVGFRGENASEKLHDWQKRSHAATQGSRAQVVFSCLWLLPPGPPGVTLLPSAVRLPVAAAPRPPGCHSAAFGC